MNQETLNLESIADDDILIEMSLLTPRIMGEFSSLTIELGLHLYDASKIPVTKENLVQALQSELSFTAAHMTNVIFAGNKLEEPYSVIGGLENLKNELLVGHTVDIICKLGIKAANFLMARTSYGFNLSIVKKNIKLEGRNLCLLMRDITMDQYNLVVKAIEDSKMLIIRKEETKTGDEQ